MEILDRDLEQRSWEISYRDPGRRWQRLLSRWSCAWSSQRELEEPTLVYTWYLFVMCLATSLAGYVLGGSRPTENFHGFSLSNFRNLETPFFGDFRNVFIQNASADPADILVRPEVREMSPGKSKAEFTWRCLEIYAPGDALIECTNNWSTRLFGVPRRGPCNIYFRIRDRNLMEYI